MLVSCIITTFNRPDMVVGAIESVLAQSYENIELIVVDDCSTADYSPVVNEYKKKINYIRTEKNSGGVSVGRNVGIEHAKGELVAFLDDDDRWYPLKIAEQVKYMVANKDCPACSTGHIASVSGKSDILKVNKIEAPDLYLKNIIGPPSKLMVRADVLENIKFDETLKHAEDWDIYLQLTKIGPIGYVPAPLVNYNTDHHHRMTNQFSTLTRDQIEGKLTSLYKNRALIGEKNFQIRKSMYYMTGIKKRTNKFSQVRLTINEVGFGIFLNYFYKKMRDLV